MESIVVAPSRSPIKLATSPNVNIEFNDLNYSVGSKKIIRGISGQFRSGQLSAIMGPSGAGKSTLMNMLVGYTTTGVTGSIKTNGQPRRMKVFNRLCSYIMQEDLLQPHLTVREIMLVAAHLKLGSAKYTLKARENAVDEILATLGLSSCRNTFTDKLSGGQRKRVSVAQELVNNPPVVFLDEPTSGLDVVSIKQVVDLLKLLSSQGRTVVCTVHQPSSLLFHFFDNIYLLAAGRCIFHGASTQLVPFLASSSFHCPSTYNPADYVFEILNNSVVDALSEEIQNGRIEKTEPNNLNRLNGFCEEIREAQKGEFDFPTTFWEQFRIVLGRMMLQRGRNKTGLRLQVIHHIMSGFLVGAIFWGVGPDASRPFDNFKFCLCVTVFFMYTHCMTPVLTYPFLVKVMKREYFNRWYSLKAFYLAQTISTLPLIFILTLSFVIIVYTMSQQPMEAARFAWFASNCILMAFISEGLGTLIGFSVNCTNGAVLGPSSMAPVLMLAIQGMGYGQSIPKVMLHLMKFSFLRYALVGIITSLYLDGRVMKCPSEVDEIYCFYKDPKLLVRDLAMADERPLEQVPGLVFYLIFFRLIAYFCLRYRVTTDFSNRILVYASKILSELILFRS